MDLVVRDRALGREGQGVREVLEVREAQAALEEKED